MPKYEPREQAAPPSPRAARGGGERQARHLDRRPTPSTATIYERDRLDIGATLAGPAVVEQFDATTVIPPGWRGRVDGFRNLILATDVARMERSEIRGSRSEPALRFGRGRDASYLAPPAQIRTCSFPAYGSYLGYLTANRWLGQGWRMRGGGSQSSASCFM